MREPIQRINTYTVPASGSVAHDVERFLDQRVREIVGGLPNDPALEVATTPRGDYLEVMIFAGRQDTKAAVEAKAEQLKEELREMGVATVFYVKTWTGTPT
jgi:hypothetical protein